MLRKTWAELLSCVAEIGEVNNYFKFWRRKSKYGGTWWSEQARKEGGFESQLRRAGM